MKNLLVIDALVVALQLCTDGVAFFVHGLVARAANHRHTAFHLLSLHAHDLSHFLSTVVAAGSTLADFSFALQDSFCVAAAAGIATAAAVCTGQALVQQIQTGIGFPSARPSPPIRRSSNWPRFA